MRTRAERWRIGAGALLWSAVLIAIAARLRDPVEGRDLRAAEAVLAFLAAREMPVTVRFATDVEIEPGDPVYLETAGGAISLAGEVRSIGPLAARTRDPQPPPGPGAAAGAPLEAACILRSISPVEGLRYRARLVSVPQTASWVLRTLLPPEKLERIAIEWNEMLLLHREEIFHVLNPVLTAILRDLEEVLSESLPGVLEAHRAKLGALGSRLQGEILQAEFAPLLQNELWPLIAVRARPTLDAIGEEVLRRLPVWGFAWRYVYESLPLTGRGALRAEADRFFQEETLPILRAHSGDFIEIFGDIAREASRNERVAAAFRRSFDRLLQDEEVKHEARLLLQELILDNPRFHDRMLERWGSPEVTRALEVLSTRLEPFVRRIGDLVLGTRGGGITPEFARVLRTQILQKDRRSLILEPIDGASPPSAAGAPLSSGAILPGIIEGGRR